MATPNELAALEDKLFQQQDILNRALAANARMPDVVAPVDIDVMRSNVDDAVVELERAKVTNETSHGETHMAMSETQFLAWWDSTTTALAGKHPRLAGVINYVKGLGDREIPRLVGTVPTLPTPKALFDWVMQQLEAAFPAEAFFLNVIQALVDSWLSPAGTLPTP